MPSPERGGPEFAATRNLILVTGKGGVGKTAFSQALAFALAKTKKVLWINFDDPNRKPGERYLLTQKFEAQIPPERRSQFPFSFPLPQVNAYNCEAGSAFEEYIHLKVGKLPLANLFLNSPVIKSLVRASPGIHELVQLGKVWHERKFFDHLVVDLPSSGYAVAMFQSMTNFKNLFRTGPVVRDAEGMLSTFNQPELASLFILTLPEEMPVREGIELRSQLQSLFPGNPSHVVCNRLLREPKTGSLTPQSPTSDSSSLVPTSAEAFAQERTALEWEHLQTFERERIPYWTLPFDLATVQNPELGPLYLSQRIETWVKPSESREPRPTGAQGSP